MFSLILKVLINLPKSGTASDVAGIVSATIFKNTVNDSKIVTPGNINELVSIYYVTENVFAFTQKNMHNKNHLHPSYSLIPYVNNVSV